MADRGHDLQFHQAVGQQAQGPAGGPAGWFPARQGNELGFGGPIEAAHIRPRRRFALQGGGQAILDKLPPHALHGGDGNLNGGGDICVQQAAVGGHLIGFEENARMRLPGGGRMFFAQEG